MPCGRRGRIISLGITVKGDLFYILKKSNMFSVPGENWGKRLEEFKSKSVDFHLMENSPKRSAQF